MSIQILGILLADENKTCENTTSTNVSDKPGTTDKANFAYTGGSAKIVGNGIQDNSSLYETSYIPTILNAWYSYNSCKTYSIYFIKYNRYTK